VSRVPFNTADSECDMNTAFWGLVFRKGADSRAAALSH
jgi:hypothetical protein